MAVGKVSQKMRPQLRKLLDLDHLTMETWTKVFNEDPWFVDFVEGLVIKKLLREFATLAEEKVCLLPSYSGMVDGERGN